MNQFDLSYLTLVAAIANFTLGIFVLSRRWKKPLYVYFFAFTTIDALWALSNYIFEKHNRSLFVFESQYAFGGLTLVAAILWIIILINEKEPQKKLFPIYVFGAIVLLFPYINGLVIDTITSGPSEEFSFNKGPLFDLFSATLFVFLTVLFYKLIRAVKKSVGIKKIQFRYVLAGVTIFAAVAITIGLILPVFFGFDSFVAFDAQSSVLWVILTTFAIIRHRLLDIRFILTRSIIYATLVTLVALSFIFILFVSAQFFGGSAVSRNLQAFLIAILIVFGLDPLKRLLSRATDKVFFKAKIDYQQVLRKLSETLNYELDQTKLITELRETLTQELKIKSATTLLRKTSHGDTEKFEALPRLLSENPNLSLRNDSELIVYLRKHRHPAIFESLERKIDDTKEDQRGPLLASQHEFERLGASLVTPIFAQDHLVAVLVLGPKLSGDTFSNDDVQLIEVLSPQIGSAIQKANLFEEVRQFGENLKVKVQEATEELQERNVSLQTLQTITKEVTRTLDFSQAVQNIANSVALELGYLGAILVFLDDDGKTVRARAITQTPLTKKAMKLLPVKFDAYHTDISSPDATSLGHQVIRSGEIQMTGSLADVISPPLPRILAHSIQKLMGLKSMVVVPIISESKTIGVIEIGLRKSVDQIRPQEIATMQSLADELGIVSRNLKLFSQLKATNDQLEVANQHLQELDRAKSEFVSIASHQLRTPMTGIMGYLSMMTQGDFGKIKPDHQKILVDLLAESQRMIRLINQFLNVSKIESGKFTYTKTPVQIETLAVREMQEVAKAARDKGLKLVNKFPKKLLPKVTADADKLQDVILNLIDNAIKYTDKGSIIIASEQTRDSLHFSVKDSGIGIKPQDATELFSKFVRGSGIAQIHPDGSGLGLFIAKSIIDAHGGRIWAESEGEGKGSTFQFTIPLVPHPDAPDAHPHQAAAHVVKPRSNS